MNTLVIVAIAAVCLLAGYTLYGRWLANKWGIDPKAKTPAYTKEDGKDYVTLVTCTPYGINTHRLLVRGHRVETKASASAIRVTADAIQIEPKLVAPAVAVPILVVLLIWVLLHSRKRKR